MSKRNLSIRILLLTVSLAGAILLAGCGEKEGPGAAATGTDAAAEQESGTPEEPSAGEFVASENGTERGTGTASPASETGRTPEPGKGTDKAVTKDPATTKKPQPTTKPNTEHTVWECWEGTYPGWETCWHNTKFISSQDEAIKAFLEGWNDYARENGTTQISKADLNAQCNAMAKELLDCYIKNNNIPEEYDEKCWEVARSVAGSDGCGWAYSTTTMASCYSCIYRAGYCASYEYDYRNSIAMGLYYYPSPSGGTMNEDSKVMMFFVK